jgi:hypothetical protein
VARVEGRCTSTEEQAESRKDTEETHDAVGVISESKGEKREREILAQQQRKGDGERMRGPKK